MFVTAAHCIEGIPVEELWVNHHGGPPPNLFTRLGSIECVKQADIAVFATEAPGSKWAVPFERLRYVADSGEEVCAFGYPEDLISDAPANETPRLFRGNVQRPFLYQRADRRYRAFELSFPCPPGLSGGPVFLASDPRSVIGVVTGNFESCTVRHVEVKEIRPGEVSRFEEQKIITYGIAANIFNVRDAIEKLLGRPLPDPEPETYP